MLLFTGHVARFGSLAFSHLPKSEFRRWTKSTAPKLVEVTPPEPSPRKDGSCASLLSHLHTLMSPKVSAGPRKVRCQNKPSPRRTLLTHIYFCFGTTS